jgi:hypothetical protein
MVVPSRTLTLEQNSFRKLKWKFLPISKKKILGYLVLCILWCDCAHASFFEETLDDSTPLLLICDHGLVHVCWIVSVFLCFILVSWTFFFFCMDFNWTCKAMDIINMNLTFNNLLLDNLIYVKQCHKINNKKLKNLPYLSNIISNSQGE